MTIKAESDIANIVIIGIGSPFGGDSLGWRVVEWLQQHPRCIPTELGNVQMLTLDRPGAALLTHLQSQQAVILIDALRAGLPPGTLKIFTAQELIELGNPVTSHGFGLRETLTLGQALGDLPPRLYVMGVEMGDDAEFSAKPHQIAQLGLTIGKNLSRMLDDLTGNELGSRYASHAVHAQ